MQIVTFLTNFQLVDKLSANFWAVSHSHHCFLVTSTLIKNQMICENWNWLDYHSSLSRFKTELQSALFDAVLKRFWLYQSALFLTVNQHCSSLIYLVQFNKNLIIIYFIRSKHNFFSFCLKNWKFQSIDEIWVRKDETS